MNILITVSFDRVLRIHNTELKKFGGLQGIRDISLLASALAQAELHLFGTQVYTTAHEIAGVYTFHIIKNHPFVDGNKRTGIGVAIIFLLTNNYFINATTAEIYDFTMRIASSDITLHEVISFFEQRIFKVNLPSAQN